MFNNSYIQEIQTLFQDFMQKLHVYVGMENGFGNDLKEYFNDLYSCFGCGEFISEAQKETYLEWESNYVSELKALANSKGFDIRHDRSKKTFKNGGAFYLDRIDKMTGDEVIEAALGDLSKCIRYDMLGNMSGLLELFMSYARKKRKSKFTKEIAEDIKSQLTSGIEYLETVTRARTYELGDFYYDVLEPKFDLHNGEAWIACKNYVHDVNLQAYDKVYAKYEELRDLCPTHEYVLHLEGTSFAEGFDTFYNYLITESGRCYAMDAMGYIYNGLVERIALCVGGKE